MTRTMICGTLIALMMAGPAWSQAEAVPAVPAFVSVSQGLTAHGHGEIKVKPDIARLTAGVTTRAKYQDKAVQDNADKMTALLAAVRGLKVADKDIQTQGYSVEPQYEYSDGHSRLTGYQVTNSVEVTLRDLTQTGVLIDTMTQAGLIKASAWTASRMTCQTGRRPRMRRSRRRSRTPGGGPGRWRERWAYPWAVRCR